MPLKNRIAQWFGRDGRLIAFVLLTALMTVVGFSASTLIANQPWNEAIARFLPGVVYMVGWALLLSPIIVPIMLLGWMTAWFLGRLARLPSRMRVILAAGVSGVSATLPLVYGFGHSGQGAENARLILIYPLLYIAPVSAMISGAITYRQQ